VLLNAIDALDYHQVNVPFAIKDTFYLLQNVFQSAHQWHSIMTNCIWSVKIHAQKEH